MGILQSIFCCCWDSTEQPTADLTTTLVTNGDNSVIRDVVSKYHEEDTRVAGNYSAPTDAAAPINSNEFAPVTAESLASVLHHTPKKHTIPGSTNSSPASASSAASSRLASPKFCVD